MSSVAWYKRISMKYRNMLQASANGRSRGLNSGTRLWYPFYSEIKPPTIPAQQVHGHFQTVLDAVLEDRDHRTEDCQGRQLVLWRSGESPEQHWKHGIPWVRHAGLPRIACIDIEFCENSIPYPSMPRYSVPSSPPSL